MNKKMQERSKYLSYILRHKPEEVKSKLDEYGWLPVKDLIENSDFTRDELISIVQADTRYEFSSDLSQIRAFHGHSVKGIKYQNEVTEPIPLYHGTSIENYNKIVKSQAILPMSRAQVHMSASKEDAVRIAKRHNGDSVVLVIDTYSLLSTGHHIYKSEDNVYLVDKIPLSCVEMVLDA